VALVDDNANVRGVAIKVLAQDLLGSHASAIGELHYVGLLSHAAMWLQQEKSVKPKTGPSTLQQYDFQAVNTLFSCQ
jgi:hypothetical protein